MIAPTRWTSTTRTDSVTSRTNEPASRPDRASAVCTSVTNSGSWSWHAETLTETVSSRWPCSCQARHWRTASFSTHRPTGTISRLRSSSGMKSNGGTEPISGWSQRSNASIPTISPPSLNNGW